MSPLRGLAPLLAGLALAGASVAAPAPVRYCDHPVYPPISWTDAHGTVQGLAPRAVREVLGALGLPVEVVVLGNWKRCLSDAAEGRVDLVIAYRSAERERSLLFSREPLLREEVSVFYNRRKPLAVTRLEDLAQYRGGLLLGESYGQAFDAFVQAHGNVEWVASNQQNFGKLIRGRIDFIAHERRTGKLYLEHLPGADEIEVLPLTLAVDHLYFAVSKRSPLAARMADIDRQLQLLVSDERVARWLRESELGYRALQSRSAEQP
ncbi:transporter substrate-binding domain-containing protein [Pseudomonas lalucatii]|uniref:Transporter substrate-binding domain-containing protein n=1 Tax=Pseudomonas lalucatii TaxID=1424203 RepID=A0ABS5Q4R3_9PSED|nr:transporter substrate-binding domain-containing protein [Pseudomonas lalucatii]MBS7663288.1 transporter substrate-binding domain-containing protein [Pseudomonas lalucatii]QVM87090.1 transporter substrate-binding domain-containing protein [Pseudomonas lalucatii]